MITSTGENPTRSAFGEPLKSGAQLGSRIKYQSFDVLNRAAGFAAARHGRAAPVSGSDAVGGAKSYFGRRHCGPRGRAPTTCRARFAGAEGRSQAICLMLRTTEDAKSASIAQPYPRLLWGFRCADERGASAASSVRGRTIVMLFPRCDRAVPRAHKTRGAGQGRGARFARLDLAHRGGVVRSLAPHRLVAVARRELRSGHGASRSRAGGISPRRSAVIAVSAGDPLSAFAARLTAPIRRDEIQQRNWVCRTGAAIVTPAVVPATIVPAAVVPAVVAVGVRMPPRVKTARVETAACVKTAAAGADSARMAVAPAPREHGRSSDRNNHGDRRN
jgi:hypothetical protein